MKGAFQWNLGFRRPLYEWELSSLSVILDKLREVVLDASGIDKCQWRATDLKPFTVKSCYTSLIQTFGGEFLENSVWIRTPTLKLVFTVWAACHAKLPTVDNLMRKGWSMVNICELCKRGAEMGDHLFLHCPIAREVWDFILYSFNITAYTPPTVELMLCSWQSFKLPMKGRKLWQVISFPKNNLLLKGTLFYWSRGQEWARFFRFEDFVFRWDIL
ncbi:Reverse transcriptase zinc-binding domain [Macleaya cordata]|uniref:Reverse transcriptase zinc-binding domain n=1 Tax=Macleaya cordata TaxID=56857 RepID=A0A200QJL8_MACCD|nr:Reverse transcriptase zinc-binding domain [Macleaya cordata]